MIIVDLLGLTVYKPHMAFCMNQKYANRNCSAYIKLFKFQHPMLCDDGKNNLFMIIGRINI